jgi:hypothetical protein
MGVLHLVGGVDSEGYRASVCVDRAPCFSHSFRVFEVERINVAQVEVVLISNPDSSDDQMRADRVTTGTCIASLRILVDCKHAERFAKGQHFVVHLKPQDD